MNLRYSRELRDNLAMLRRVLVSTPTGAQVPLSQLAELEIKKGPPVHQERERAAQRLDLHRPRRRGRRNLGRRGPKETLARELELPAGYSITWSGQYEYMERAWQRLLMVGQSRLRQWYGNSSARPENPVHH